MFSNYFQDQTKELKAKLRKRIAATTRGTARKQKSIDRYQDLNQFWTDHLPDDLHVGAGKIRGKAHMLPKSIDMIFYRKWCKQLIEMTGGWHLVDYTVAIGSIEERLTTQALINHINITNAIKTLYAKSKEYGPDDYIPLLSVLWAYDNKIPLLSHQKAIYDAQKEKDVPYNCEIDLVIILDQGIIMKDWSGGNFKVIETGKDTLMWGYILTTEYLGLDQTLQFAARDYVKRTENYEEY